MNPNNYVGSVGYFGMPTNSIIQEIANGCLKKGWDYTAPYYRNDIHKWILEIYDENNLCIKTIVAKKHKLYELFGMLDELVFPDLNKKGAKSGIDN